MVQFSLKTVYLQSSALYLKFTFQQRRDVCIWPDRCGRNLAPLLSSCLTFRQISSEAWFVWFKMSTNVYYHRSSSAVHLQALTCGRWTLLHSHHENHILLLPLETVREIDKEYSRWDPLTSLSRLIKKYGFYSHNIWKELWEFIFNI